MKRVEVEWVDSCAVQFGWDDVDTYRERHQPDLIRSVGVLLDEKPDSIMLCLSWTPEAENPKRDKDSVNDCMVIPRVAIRAIHELRRR